MYPVPQITDNIQGKMYLYMKLVIPVFDELVYPFLVHIFQTLFLFALQMFKINHTVAANSNELKQSKHRTIMLINTTVVWNVNYRQQMRINLTTWEDQCGLRIVGNLKVERSKSQISRLSDWRSNSIFSEVVKSTIVASNLLNTCLLLKRYLNRFCFKILIVIQCEFVGDLFVTHRGLQSNTTSSYTTFSYMPPRERTGSQRMSLRIDLS